MVNLSPNRDQETTIVQQGNLKSNRTTETGVSGETVITETVPIGKKWTLKCLSIYSNNAATNVKLYAWKNSGEYCILETKFDMNAGDQIATKFNNEITLGYGWSIKFFITHGVASTVTTDTLIQESSA